MTLKQFLKLNKISILLILLIVSITLMVFLLDNEISSRLLLISPYSIILLNIIIQNHRESRIKWESIEICIDRFFNLLYRAFFQPNWNYGVLFTFIKEKETRKILGTWESEGTEPDPNCGGLAPVNHFQILDGDFSLSYYLYPNKLKLTNNENEMMLYSNENNVDKKFDFLSQIQVKLKSLIFSYHRIRIEEDFVKKLRKKHQSLSH